MLASGARLGNWKVVKVLGKGFQGNAVYLAQEAAGNGRSVALKYPADEEELRYLGHVHDLPGVVDILEVGDGPCGHYFAMPVLEPSLEEVLRRCDHDGLGGRISWAAAQGLGLSLVDTLRKVHAKGLVHCDLKPANILLGASGDTRPQLIDFGISRTLDAPPFEGVRGTLDFNSIRAGRCGERSPADDLEAVGWLLLRCVLGQMPWKFAASRVAALNSIALTDDMRRQNEELRKFRSRQISDAKERLLELPSGQAAAGCPPELHEYLRHARGLSSGTIACGDTEYWKLRALLCGGKRPRSREKAWEQLVEACRQPQDWPHVVAAVRGQVVWKPEGPTPEGVAARSLVPRELRLRLSGQRQTCEAGGQWLELEPLWTPGVPAFLRKRNWLLVADAEAEEEGPLLVPIAHESRPGATAAGEDHAPWRFFMEKKKPEAHEKTPVAQHFAIAGSWDDWAEFTDFLPFAGGGPSYWVRASFRKAPGSEEFQIFRDRRWQARYYPSGGHIVGPENCESAPNWQVRVPAGCAWMQVIWDPSGARRVECLYWGLAGEPIEWLAEPSMPLPSVGKMRLQEPEASTEPAGGQKPAPAVEEVPRLTLEGACAMLDDLIAEYGSDEFQRELHEAWAEQGAWDEGKGVEAKRILARRKATFPPQCRVLPRFGFAASDRGVAESYWAVQRHYEDDLAVRKRNMLIGWLTNPPMQMLGPPPPVY